MNNILNSFKTKDTLNPDIWDNVDSSDASTASIKPEIRKSILKISKDFVEFLDIEGIDIEDVYLLGSISNFNWSQFSDIDVHVVIDIENIEASEAIIDELFGAKKTIYNSDQDIKIKGYDVELYAQKSTEVVESEGIYSVLYNKWIEKPIKTEFSLDKKNIIKKVKQFKSQLSVIKKMADSKPKLNRIKRLKDKIKKYRKAALSSEGEMSYENLTFKYLRRSGFMDELNDLKIKTNDSILSLENEIL